MRILIVLLLLVIALPVSAQSQDQRERKPNERLRRNDDMARERFQLELLDRKEQEQDEAPPDTGPPDIVPEGWQHDYDYRLNLFEYLARKQAGAKIEQKDTYVYVYADWNEACRTFRKSASHKDYKKLLSDSEVLMVEYVFLKRIYKAQINRVPVFVKVHDNGILGPEFVHPVSAPSDHPRKAYYKLKKFIESPGT